MSVVAMYEVNPKTGEVSPDPEWVGDVEEFASINDGALDDVARADLAHMDIDQSLSFDFGAGSVVKIVRVA